MPVSDVCVREDIRGKAEQDKRLPGAGCQSSRVPTDAWPRSDPRIGKKTGRNPIPIRWRPDHRQNLRNRDSGPVLNLFFRIKNGRVPVNYYRISTGFSASWRTGRAAGNAGVPHALSVSTASQMRSSKSGMAALTRTHAASIGTPTGSSTKSPMALRSDPTKASTASISAWRS